MFDKLPTWMSAIVDKVAKLSYIANDPTTPDLILSMSIPALPNPCPNFRVIGWTNDTNLIPGTPTFQAAQVYCTMSVALNVVQNHLPQPLIRWSNTDNLLVVPRAGQQLNAFYDRSALKFFYSTDKVLNKVVFSCESADVVSHELGHAILDTLRPDLWNTASFEIFSFHEAFGDIIAIATILEHSEIIDKVITETNGDLTKSNISSRIAEELGITLYHASNGSQGHSNCLRDAANSFVYVKPSSLPKSVKNDNLANEPHNFSRLFTGAWYDCLVEIYKINSTDMKQHDSLVKARNVALELLLKAAIHAPSIPEFYKSVARTMIEETFEIENGRYTSAVRNVFAKRGIMVDSSVSLFNTDIIDPSVEGNNINIALNEPICGCKNLIVHIPRFGMGIAGEASGDVIKIAHHAVHYLNSKSLIGTKSENKMFMAHEGSLKRRYVCGAFAKD